MIENIDRYNLSIVSGVYASPGYECSCQHISCAMVNCIISEFHDMLDDNPDIEPIRRLGAAI